jgi:uncharacterized CHY-type Zn-finger protein
VERIKCHVCDMQKHELEKYKSKVTNMEMFICKTCKQSGLEPRYMLIIGFNSGGTMREKAKKFIKNRQYLGDTILLVETL